MPELINAAATHLDCQCRTRLFFHFHEGGSGENQLMVHALAGTPRVQVFRGAIPTVMACPNCGCDVPVPQLDKRFAVDRYFQQLGDITE